jgi:hypothetical protein
MPILLETFSQGLDQKENESEVRRRLISERCLYGVDKNPMAVEMAKLSLWLITLAKNRPFTFLDHALRSGDSLQDVLGMEYVVLAKGYDEALRHGENEHGWAAKRDGFKKMRDEVDVLLKGRKPFHWPLEFPEVFVGKGDDGGRCGGGKSAVSGRSKNYRSTWYKLP